MANDFASGGSDYVHSTNYDDLTYKFIYVRVSLYIYPTPHFVIKINEC